MSVYTESVGNWKTHKLVRCCSCDKLMGYHKDSKTAKCNSCERKERNKANKEK